MIILLFGRRPPQFSGTVRKIHLKTAQDHIEETQTLIANGSAIENTGTRQVFLGRGLEEWTHELPGCGDIIRSAVCWSRYNFKVKDNRNETPLHVARTHGRVEVVQCSVPSTYQLYSLICIEESSFQLSGTIYSINIESNPTF